MATRSDEVEGADVPSGPDWPDDDAADEEASEEEERINAELEGAAEQAPDDAGARSQKEIEAVTRRLEREAERHAKRVAEIMGEDFALLVPSPVDWTPGFLFNVPQMLPTTDQVAALDAILGRDEESDLVDADDAEACDKCNARGHTRTQSKVEGQKTKPCRKCNGTGWVSKMAPPEPAPAPTWDTSKANGAPVTPDTYQVKDSWGRPMAHPHFGRDPVTVGV